MRILTVRQPWASAIISGAKTVENRATNIAGAYRGPIALHAGLREDVGARSHPEVIRWAREYWGTEAGALFTGDRSKFGHIIGVVDLVDVHHAGNCYAASIDRAAELYRTDRAAFDALPVKNGSGGLLSRADYCSPWADDAGYHLVLANPRALDEPIPYKGGLGLRKTDFVVEGDWLAAPWGHPRGQVCTPYGCEPGCHLEPVAKLTAVTS